MIIKVRDQRRSNIQARGGRGTGRRVKVNTVRGQSDTRGKEKLGHGCEMEPEDKGGEGEARGEEVTEGRETKGHHSSVC